MTFFFIEIILIFESRNSPIMSKIEISKETVEEHNKIIASKRDQEIFFNELTNPSKPNKALVNAVKRYKKVISS
jgi:uncharacterized protein (DUF1778 family)